MEQNRNTLLALKGYKVRTEQYRGKDHIVVPVVALVEGVVHAMNATSAEFVSCEAFSHAPAGWNGRPVFLGHPMREGRPVSGNTPEVLAEEQIGIVFNSKVKDKKLVMEAWVDVERCEEYAPKLLQRLKDGDTVEISVGVMVSTDQTEGEYNGKKYLGAWKGIMPDHLALLPEGDLGACSVDAGCGVRAASNPEGHNQYTDGGAAAGQAGAAKSASTKADAASEKANGREKGTNQEKADRHSDAAVAHGKAADVHSTVAGKQKDATERDYHNSMAESHRKKADGHAKAAGIFATIDTKDEALNAKGVAVKTNDSVLGRILAAMPGLRSLMNTEDMTDNDLRSKLYKAVQAKYPNCSYVDAFYPAENPTNVVFTCYHQSTSVGPEVSMGYQYKTYDMAFTTDANGEVTLTGEASQVEAVMRYEPVTAAGAEPKVAASGKPCSCQHPQPTIEEKAMQKAERVTALIGKSKVFTEADRAMLEASSDDQMTRFEAHSAAPAAPAAAAVAETPAAPAAPVATPAAAPVAEAAKEEPKAPTFEDLLKKADPATREAIESGVRIANAKKAVTIKALKDTGRCKVTDESLNAMSQEQLDQLVELAGSNVRAAIDYSGQGNARQPEAVMGSAPAPKDLGAEIRAARGQK